MRRCLSPKEWGFDPKKNAGHQDEAQRVTKSSGAGGINASCEAPIATRKFTPDSELTVSV